ncbi:hypothetical protein D3C87_1303580 [compost metagenome]
MPWISWVLICVRLASARTSSATTAKPRPASPARAASMAALSASRLVCSAIERITPSTLTIDDTSFCRLSKDTPLLRMSSTRAWIFSMLPATTRLAACPSSSVCWAATAALCALLATSWAAADIWLIAVAT